MIHPTHFSIFQETPYLVLPYCKLGSSELLIGNKLENENIWKYILDVSSGLAYLHALTPPIIHQDIKPANVLLDDTLHYAITDFGISAQKGGVHGYYYDEENSGTLAYMAPERFQEGAEPIPQSDIWAFGATLCEILTGNVPFGEEGGNTQMEGNTPIPSIPGVSADIQRLIHACLAKEPGDRPSAEQIVKAAERKQYPVKSKKVAYGIMIVMLMMLLVSAYYFLSKPNEEIMMYQPSPDELYNVALEKMKIDDEDSVKAGLVIMDSLSKTNYIPAVYQCVYTYGWYNELESKRRKKILGIEMTPNGVPVSDIYINKAIALYTQIVGHNDSLYGKEKADAGYRLAWYYLEQYINSKENLKKSRDYLRNSSKWAMMVNDSLILQRINDGLKQINRELNDNNY